MRAALANAKKVLPAVASQVTELMQEYPSPTRPDEEAMSPAAPTEGCSTATSDETSAIPEEYLRKTVSSNLLDDDEVMSLRESDVIIEETIEETIEEPMEPSTTNPEGALHTIQGIDFFIDSQEDDWDRDLKD